MSSGACEDPDDHLSATLATEIEQSAFDHTWVHHSERCLASKTPLTSLFTFDKDLRPQKSLTLGAREVRNRC